VQSSQPQPIYKLSWPILFTGLALGFLLSFAALSGDEQGRVNVLYLLLVFVFIPLLSIVISIGSLITGKGINLARLTSKLPILSASQSRVLHQLQQKRLDKLWLFMQSQAAALAYAVASMLTFVLLLLVTDINFVWRSTLLDASDLLPMLNTIASPWWFWQAAQPDLALLQATQDSRLTQLTQGALTSDPNTLAFANWWPFVFATLLVYSFFARGVLFLVTRFWLSRQSQQDIQTQLDQQWQQHQRRQPSSPTLSDITHTLPSHLAITNWAGLSDPIKQQLPSQCRQSSELFAGPLASDEQQHQAEQHSGEQLVLVKAWEPPMAELEDYLKTGQGYLLPVNYRQHQLLPPETQHLNEWRRFAAGLNQWRLYLPEQWITSHD
jgi:hypothetical protein